MTRTANHQNSSYERLVRKASQHWEMAGLARQDNGQKDAERHIAEAKRLEKEAALLL